MAAPVEVTSEGGEGQNEKSIDYIGILRSNLREKKLLYIEDIILEYDNDTTLEVLLMWDRNEIVALLVDINNDESVQHKIKTIHRNKFADEIKDIAKQQQGDAAKEKVAPSASSQVKLLFLGKEEEEAAEAIQSVRKMQQLFNNLDENTKNVQQDLQKLCGSLKQQIDTKQKEIVKRIKIIHQYHLNQLNKRNESTQSTAKVVSKVNYRYLYMSLFHNFILAQNIYSVLQ